VRLGGRECSKKPIGNLGLPARAKIGIAEWNGVRMSKPIGLINDIIESGEGSADIRMIVTIGCSRAVSTHEPVGRVASDGTPLSNPGETFDRLGSRLPLNR
jgi:hypothetical protein